MSGLKWPVYEVFIASPIELGALHAAISDRIWLMNREGASLGYFLVPRMCEDLLPALGSGQPRVDKQLEPADFLIAIFSQDAGRGGTEHEVSTFEAQGRGDRAMVYLQHNPGPDAPAVRRLKARFGRGISSYHDVTQLVDTVANHLRNKVEEHRKRPNRGWSQLIQHAAEIEARAPSPLARYLIDACTEPAAARLRDVAEQVKSLDSSTGLQRYQQYVHEKLLTTERFWAVCVDKGLIDHAADKEYFEPFYRFGPKGARSFIQPKSGRYSQRVQAVINQHRQAGLLVLEVARSSRKVIENVYPGLCGQLDEGFGFIGFEARDGTLDVVVHAGQAGGLRFAHFRTPELVNSVFEMLKGIYLAGNGRACEWPTR